MNQLPNIVLDITGVEYLLPYFERQFRASEIDSKEWPAPCTGIKVETDEAEGLLDPEFEAYCNDQELPVVVLRCPYIVGTGMQGIVRRIAAGIYRGTYVNIEGNEARISLVHATDVARAAEAALGCQGTYTLTDQAEHTINELAEALGRRMNDKRIFSLKPRWARWWLGKKFCQALTTDHVASDTFHLAFPDFAPANVTEYLTTHVYNHESL